MWNFVKAIEHHMLAHCAWKFVSDLNTQISRRRNYFRLCKNISGNPHSALWTAIAQSVQRLATGWKVRRSNSGTEEIFRARPDSPWGPPSLLQRVKRSGRGVNHPPPLCFHSRQFGPFNVADHWLKEMGTDFVVLLHVDLRWSQRLSKECAFS
jgi:hypothetical protein